VTFAGPMHDRGLADRVVSDGLANLLRFAVTALSVLAVTPVISRALDPGSFSVWTLVVSISTYVALAEAGTTSAVTRFVASDLVSESGQTPSILASAIWLLALSASFAVGILSSIALWTNWMFRDTPAQLIGRARVSVIILGVGVGIGIIGIAIQGYFFAIHRAIVPSLVTVTVRVSVAIGLLITVLATRSVVWLAVVTFTGAATSTLIIGVLARRSVGTSIAAPRLVRRSWARELAKHSSTLIGWSLAMVVITGLDLVVVGTFDFGSVGGYGIAAQGVSLILGLFGAAIAPLTATAARRHAQGSPEAVSAILLDFSRVAVTILVAASSVLFVAAPWLVELYAGPRYAHTASTVLRILLVGNVLRNTCGPLTTVLVATGEHRRVLAPPFVEAAVNLTLSLWWVHLFQANGVAWATVVGAFVGVGLHLLITLHRTHAFKVTSVNFAVQTIGRPALAGLPALILVSSGNVTHLNKFVATAVAILGSAAVAWTLSLDATDRRRLRELSQIRKTRRH
jgi:O-antigen/teichoic acid export membrane protein